MPLKPWLWLLPKRRHFIVLAIFVSLLLIAMYVFVKNSGEYKEAEQFIAHDQQVAKVIGKVQRVDFKFWRGFEHIESNGGHARYWFDVTTDQGVFSMQVYLRKCDGRWQVKTVDIHARTGIKTSISFDHTTC